MNGGADRQFVMIAFTTDGAIGGTAQVAGEKISGGEYGVR